MDDRTPCSRRPIKSRHHTRVKRFEVRPRQKTTDHSASGQEAPVRRLLTGPTFENLHQPSSLEMEVSSAIMKQEAS
ncbi:unnamed protein product [Protopolystoma xenopodis]|uniref:Uncharacterized protein n=1 Tax=Protopolystoma xenopodis TaxID=117903 RepID=A0A3S5CGT2_9PLAT|nr:unnamed protein product [Protopolystoma xenopodis]